jgi:hypothetical protein
MDALLGLLEPIVVLEESLMLEILEINLYLYFFLEHILLVVLMLVL